MYSNNELVGTRIAAGAIPAFSIIIAGSSDGYASVAVGATVHMIGISPNYAVSAGEAFKFTFAGEGQVKAENTITAGDLITSGTTGTALTLVNAGTVHVHSVGSAVRGAAAGDIFPIMVVPQDTLV